MPNIKTKINTHNRVILRNTLSKNAQRCHCQQKENCLTNSDWLKESLVCYANITCNDKNYKPKLYKGSCEISFKKRSSNHKKLFKVPFYKHDTKLSTEYWNLKITHRYRGRSKEYTNPITQLQNAVTYVLQRN